MKCFTYNIWKEYKLITTNCNIIINNDKLILYLKRIWNIKKYPEFVLLISVHVCLVNKFFYENVLAWNVISSAHLSGKRKT